MPNPESGEYVIENRASGAWLQASPADIPHGNNAVEQWQGMGSSWQRWFLILQKDGSYLISNRSTGGYLDGVGTEITQENGHIITHTLNGPAGSDNQLWLMEELPFGFFKIINKMSKRVLDADFTAITQNGARVMLHTWHGATNQQWQVISIGNK